MTEVKGEAVVSKTAFDLKLRVTHRVGAPSTSPYVLLLGVGRKRDCWGERAWKRHNFELFVLTSAGKRLRVTAATAASLVETEYMLRSDSSNQCATLLQSPEWLCGITTGNTQGIGTKKDATIMNSGVFLLMLFVRVCAENLEGPTGMNTCFFL